MPDFKKALQAEHKAMQICVNLISVHLQVEWKLTRGTWRPRLLDYAKNAPEGSVVAATKSAYTVLKRPEDPALQDVQNAIKELTCLKAKLLHSLQQCPQAYWWCAAQFAVQGP